MSLINQKKIIHKSRNNHVTLLSNDTEDIKAESKKFSNNINKSANGCKCRSNCATKRCGCRKINGMCSVDCTCPNDCTNKSLKRESTADSEDEKEHLNETFEVKRVKIENTENRPPNIINHSPKRFKLSDNTFNCTSPSYPLIKREYPALANE